MMRLDTNPVLIQELETRARFPMAFKGFMYEGPMSALVFLGSSTFIVAMVWAMIGFPRWEDRLSGPPWCLIVATGLYTLYLCYAAARLGAGALAGDRTDLLLWKSSPLSALDILAGKFCGTLMPLYVEALLALPLILFLCGVLGWAPMVGGLALSVFHLLCISWFGLWGIFWSSRAPRVELAVQWAVRTVSFCLYGAPLSVAAACMAFQIPSEWPWIGVAAINPLFQLFCATSIGSIPGDLTSLGVAAGVVGGLALTLSALLVASTVERLRRI